jgi:hypothetical protein
MDHTLCRELVSACHSGLPAGHGHGLHLLPECKASAEEDRLRWYGLGHEIFAQHVEDAVALDGADVARDEEDALVDVLFDVDFRDVIPKVGKARYLQEVLNVKCKESNKKLLQRRQKRMKRKP